MEEASKNSLPPPETVANRLLEVQKKLNPYLFDDKGAMREEVRQEILKKAMIIVEYLFAKVPGLVLEDIHLTGSNATYLYHDKSDIDIKIMIKNENNPLFPQNGRYLGELLNLLAMQFLAIGGKLYIEKKFMDIKIDCVRLDFLGLYSILQNRWLIRPRPQVMAGISPEELMATYYDRCDEINKFMRQFEKLGEFYGTNDSRKMLEFYHKIVVEDNAHHLKNYLAFKILNSQRKIKKFATIAVTSYCCSLSLFKRKNNG